MKTLVKASILGVLVVCSILFLAYYNTLSREDDEYRKSRNSMIDTQLVPRDISDPKVLEAMRTVPRHLFVSSSLQELAYADHSLPIGEGQTISQPYVVALMTQSLNLSGEERVLEIGTGSGYQAAVLAEICSEVYTIEIKETLAADAEKLLRDLEYDNVQVKWADGYFGWEEKAPFNAIMVTSAVNHVPPYLLQQLKNGGRLILPLGDPTYYQTLTLVEKQGEDLVVTYITSVRFVPMTGEAQKAGSK